MTVTLSLSTADNMTELPTMKIDGLNTLLPSVPQAAQVPSTVAGKVAFVRRGTCALQTKFDNVVAAGSLLQA